MHRIGGFVTSAAWATLLRSSCTTALPAHVDVDVAPQVRRVALGQEGQAVAWKTFPEAYENNGFRLPANRPETVGKGWKTHFFKTMFHYFSLSDLNQNHPQPPISGSQGKHGMPTSDVSTGMSGLLVNPPTTIGKHASMTTFRSLPWTDCISRILRQAGCDEATPPHGTTCHYH